MKLPIIIFLSLVSLSLQADDIYLSAVQIRVKDVQKAARFYTETFGLSLYKGESGQLLLRAAGSHLDIELIQVSETHTINFPNDSQPILVFECDDIESLVGKFKKDGIEILGGDPRKIGTIGWAINFRDPFGIIHSLVEPMTKPKNSSGRIRIHNLGYYIPDVNRAHQFYMEMFGLKIIERTDKPPIMRDHKSLVDLMMHGRKVNIEPGKYPQESQVLFVFTTDDLDGMIERIKESNVRILTDVAQHRDNAKYIIIEDCYKNPIEIRQTI